MKENYIKNRVLYRMILTFLTVGVLTVLILSFFVTRSVSTLLVGKSVEEGEFALKQAQHTLEALLQGIYGDYYNLWMRNEDVISFKRESFTEKNLPKLVETLKHQVIRNGYVESIYLVDRRAGRMITNREENLTLENFYDKEALESLRDYSKNKLDYEFKVYVPRKGRVNDQEKREYLSLFFTEKDTDGEYNKALIVNISEDKLSETVNDSDRESNLLATNDDGRIVIAGGSNRFLERYRGESPKEGSYALSDYEGRREMVLGRSSEELGMKLFYFRDYEGIQREVRSTKRKLLWPFGGMVIFNLLLATFFIRRIYEPLARLVRSMKETAEVADEPMDEYRYLNRAYEDLVEKNRRITLQQIFLGTLAPEEDLMVENARPTAFCCRFPTESDALSSEALDLLPTYKDYVTPMGDNEIVGLMVEEGQEEGRSFKPFLQKLKGEAVVGLGTSLSQGEDLPKSVKRARLAAEVAQNEEKSFFRYEAMDHNREAASQNKDAISQKALDYILENFSDPELSGDRVAEHVGLSVGYLRQIFKEETKTTLNDAITQARIEEAKRLLLETEMTAKDIAEEVGFYDPRYFYTTFKKKTGKTSEQFRKGL